MRFAIPNGHASPIRLEVMVAAAYFLALLLAGLFLLFTAEGSGGQPQPLVSLGWFTRLTAVNVLLALTLAFGARRARSTPPGIRRGQQAGLLAAAVTLVAVQVGLVLAAGLV